MFKMYLKKMMGHLAFSEEKLISPQKVLIELKVLKTGNKHSEIMASITKVDVYSSGEYVTN